MVCMRFCLQCSRHPLCSVPAFTLPQIVGMDWRLDYHISSGATGSAATPVYFISLKVADNEDGKIRDVEFHCSYQVELHMFGLYSF